MRTIVEIPDTQLEALDASCARENISRAEAVRRAIAAYLEGSRGQRTASAFGIWRERRLDSLAYERTLREEWERPGRAPRKRR